jgi:alpha-tubulin suppressor-like RCC1 family protein
VWGSGSSGQLGLGTAGLANDIEHPNLLSGFDGRKVKKLGCGAEHSVALTTDGFLYAWGRGFEGFLPPTSPTQPNPAIDIKACSDLPLCRCML